jgi:hypothetical protein
MSTIAKVLIAAVLAIAGGVGGGVTLAQASNGSDDPAGDVRGPCDEAEHANDPRCAGTTAGAQTREDRAQANDDRQRRRRQRGANRGRSGHSKSDDRGGSSRSGSSGRG